MTMHCPLCKSDQVVTLDQAKRIGAVIATVGGAASGVAGAMTGAASGAEFGGTVGLTRRQCLGQYCRGYFRRFDRCGYRRHDRRQAG